MPAAKQWETAKRHTRKTWNVISGFATALLSFADAPAQVAVPKIEPGIPRNQFINALENFGTSRGRASEAGSLKYRVIPAAISQPDI
jgi:hypothetical protein